MLISPLANLLLIILTGSSSLSLDLACFDKISKSGDGGHDGGISDLYAITVTFCLLSIYRFTCYSIIVKS
ncbi:MAG TPA: hypothetical protein VFY41_04985 [Nitrososphaeraceae archaeon]|nr:hypothetical protein [Nitrososphaeraceae archaeon]